MTAPLVTVPGRRSSFARLGGLGLLLVAAGAGILCAPVCAAAGEVAGALVTEAIGTDSPAAVAALSAAFAQVPSLVGATVLVWRIEIARSASQARFLETIERIAASRAP